MGIRYSVKTRSKASLKLFNQINSFLFEEQYGELAHSPKVQKKLKEAAEALGELISKG